jgi:hypothetical protein
VRSTGAWGAANKKKKEKNQQRQEQKQQNEKSKMRGTHVRCEAWSDRSVTVEWREAVCAT